MLKKIKSIFLKKNSKSAIEFYLIDAFEIYHFLPLYLYLKDKKINVNFVAEPCFSNTSKKWFDYKNALRILKELKLHFYTKCNENAKIAFTTQRVELLDKYKNIKARLSYGIGLNNGNFSIDRNSFEGFDLIFIHGQYQKDKLKKDNAYIIGYPKYDYFKDLPFKDLTSIYNIHTKKPILLYLPTYDEDSSIQRFAPFIKSLQEDFFIVSKPHHCTARLKDKKTDFLLLKELSNVLLNPNETLFDCVRLADFVLVDAKSGASSEIVYIDKNIKFILLSPRKYCLEQYFNQDILECSKIVNNPKNLKEAILQASYPYKKPINYFYKDKSYLNLDLIFKELSRYL